LIIFPVCEPKGLTLKLVWMLIYPAMMKLMCRLTIRCQLSMMLEVWEPLQLRQMLLSQLWLMHLICPSLQPPIRS
jgi:hypothetical protein